MKLLIFHGYLLRGTGSNVYNARLAEALREAGHEVHLLCQERGTEDLPWVDAVGDWEAGELRVRILREPVRVTVYRPEIGTLLPVYVADRYAGFTAKPFPECTEAEVDRYLAANVRAVASVAARARPDGALANHLIMGPVILARALRGGYAVKVHGSALEYTVKASSERFLPFAREGLARAVSVLVGSEHTARSLWEAVGDPGLPARTRLAPPGVDVRRFRPRDRLDARTELAALAAELRRAPAPVGEPDAFTRQDRVAGSELERLLRCGREPLVAFVGKLIAAKGADLLLAAWPLVLRAEPRAGLAIVGFGPQRDTLVAMRDALVAGDFERMRELALEARGAEGGRGALHHLLAFLDGLSGAERASYLSAARGLADGVAFTGRLEHSALAALLPACAALVVPSTYPEAFGMVAVEAAACGTLPLGAAHSGLAEVSESLGETLAPEVAALLSFEVGPRASSEIGDRLIGWLALPEPEREAARASLRRTAEERFSWAQVARTVVQAAGDATAMGGSP